MESNITSYQWRELTEEEYTRLKKENLVLYRVADIILGFVLTGIIIAALISAIQIFTRTEESSFKPVVELIVYVVAAGLLLYTRKIVRGYGLKDIEERRLVACEGTFLRLEERTRGRNGTTRYDYYAIVKMPDEGEVAVECTLSEAESCIEGDRVVVVRPRDSARIQRMELIISKKGYV